MDDFKSDVTRARQKAEPSGSTETQTEVTELSKTSSRQSSPTEKTLKRSEAETTVLLEDKTLLHNASDKTVLSGHDASASTIIQAENQTDSDAIWLASEEAKSPGRVSLGECLNHRFFLDQLLGSGGMGEVFRAKDMRRVEARDDKPYVALKLLRKEFRKDTKFIVALQRESKRVQRLSHPNIVTVYDFDRDGDTAYITMEYLVGQSFDQVISKNKLSVKEAMYAIDRMARGLAFAHQEGYVHADFKPANVFFTDEKQVKILDFGIAQAVKKVKGGYVSVQETDSEERIHALSINYASLDMLAGQQALPVDDVYSLCCVAYELLTGSHPFVDKLSGRKLNAKDAATCGMQPAHIDDIPKHYFEALKKGLSFKRQDRFENAGLFLDALKPVSVKKHVIAALVAVIFLASAYISFDTWNAQRIPSLNDLSGAFAGPAQMIKEGDLMLKEGDISLAHRFYAQAWNEGNDIKNSQGSVDILKRVLDHRVDKVTKALIPRLDEIENSEFNIVEARAALKIILKGNLGTMDKQISQELDKSERAD